MNELLMHGYKITFKKNKHTITVQLFADDKLILTTHGISFMTTCQSLLKKVKEIEEY